MHAGLIFVNVPVPDFKVQGGRGVHRIFTPHSLRPPSSTPTHIYWVGFWYEWHIGRSRSLYFSQSHQRIHCKAADPIVSFLRVINIIKHEQRDVQYLGVFSLKKSEREGSQLGGPTMPIHFYFRSQGREKKEVQHRYVYNAHPLGKINVLWHS